MPETLYTEEFKPSGYPTNKTQVFNEISLMENWLIIHVINSRPLLVLYSLYIYFSQSWRFILCKARVKNAEIF